MLGPDVTPDESYWCDDDEHEDGLDDDGIEDGYDGILGEG